MEASSLKDRKTELRQEKRGETEHIEGAEAHVCVAWLRTSRNGLNEKKDSHRKKFGDRAKETEPQYMSSSSIIAKRFFTFSKL